MRAMFAKKFDKFIYDLMMKFLADHPDGGKWGVLHRPPTLERGSHQTVLADDISMDPRVLVIFMSNLITKAFNADSTYFVTRSGSLLQKCRLNHLVNCWNSLKP